MTTGPLTPLPPDRARKLEAALHDFREGESNNVGAYDKAILTLSSAALALSLTFSKDIVPLAMAKHLWALQWSWFGFGGALCLNIVGFILALADGRRNRFDALACFRAQTMTEQAFEDAVMGRDTKTFWLNVAQGIVFLFAVLVLAFYIGTNALNEASMSKNETAVSTTTTTRPANEIRAYSPGAFVSSTQSQGEAPAAVQPQAQQQTQPQAPSASQAVQQPVAIDPNAK